MLVYILHLQHNHECVSMCRCMLVLQARSCSAKQEVVKGIFCSWLLFNTLCNPNMAVIWLTVGLCCILATALLVGQLVIQRSLMPHTLLVDHSADSDCVHQLVPIAHSSSYVTSHTANNFGGQWEHNDSTSKVSFCTILQHVCVCGRW